MTHFCQWPKFIIRILNQNTHNLQEWWNCQRSDIRLMLWFECQKTNALISDQIISEMKKQRLQWGKRIPVFYGQKEKKNKESSQGEAENEHIGFFSSDLQNSKRLYSLCCLFLLFLWVLKKSVMLLEFLVAH